MNAEQHVPQFRFKGFSDSWEQHKLSDGTNKIGDGLHGTPKYSEDGDVYFVNGNNLVNGQIVITSETKRVTSNEQSKDDKALNENTILMSINGTIGNLAWYRGENLMLGKSAAYIEVSDFDKKFIYTYLQTRPVKDYYLNSLTGTTIKNLGLKAIRNTNIYTPTIDEQAKIGVLFQNLDMTITLHQRKLAKLKELKKGYLQKLFPQNSEKVPEFRFKGYSDAWEKRKYGDIAKSFQYGLNAPAKKFDGINKYLRITDIDDLTRLFKQESLTSPDTNLSNASTYLLKQGDVLFARTGASTGKTYKYRKGDGKVYFAGFLIRADLKPKFDSEFFYQTTLTDSFLDFVKVTSQRSGQPGINSKEYANKAIQVPELSEQQRIGSVLAIYDNLIAATQCKLDLLKKLKKGYLQKMFC